MGKKAKLKQERKQQSAEDLTKNHLQPTDFVKELQRQGYSLKHPQSSPEIPHSKIEPQI